MTVIYEWDVETVSAADSDEYESGECIDHHHTRDFKEAKEIAAGEPDDGTRHVIVLVRDDDEGRSWAYLEDDGTLPAQFEDAAGREVAKMPKRFIAEVAR